MNFIRSLFGIVITSTVVIGSASNTLAANLRHSWDVSHYKADDHAFTFLKTGLVKKFNADGGQGDFQFATPGKLNEYVDENGDYFARLTGTIVNQHNDNQRWKVDILFDETEMNKTKGKSEQYARENDWRFYELSDRQSGPMLVGLGDYEGSHFNLFDRSGGKHPGQLGIGASDKTRHTGNVMGFSFWFGYTGMINGHQVTGVDGNGNDGDINVNLTAASIPEPGLGLLSLALVTGGSTLLKRQKGDRTDA